MSSLCVPLWDWEKDGEQFTKTQVSCDRISPTHVGWGEAKTLSEWWSVFSALLFERSSITGGTKDLFCCFLVGFFLCFAVVVWFLGEWISVSHYALNGVHSTEAENISETRTPRLSEEACSVRGACSLKSKLQKNGLGGCSGETVLTEQNARVVSSSKLVCC